MDSPDANTSLIPSVSLTMGGGSHFAVYDPIIIISTQVLLPAGLFFKTTIVLTLRIYV